MIRNLLSRLRVGAICVGACLSLMASQSWSLGLGEIELASALNEKLNAEIELIDASGLQPSEILVSLASNEDFQRVGVERLFLLTDLRFEVTYGARGATIAVSSSQPITEPYLNFLVEVLWPSGRLLKEYTLLLDPPTFSQAAAPAVSAPRRSEASSRSTGRVERDAPSRSGTLVQMTPTAQKSAPQSPLDDELMTDRRDTLWAIASHNRASRAITVQQNMLAIQRLNPEAFINNNINLLKAGYLLSLPSESQARSLSAREAVAIVAIQNDEWLAYNRGEAPPGRETSQPQIAATSTSELQGQVDATGARAAIRADEVISEGELRIVAGAGDSATGTASEATAGKLNAALEESDRLGREVDELTYQLDREQELANSQLAVKDRQLEVKDQQIAELQAQMAQMQQQLAERQQSQTQSTSEPAPSGPWWQSPYVLGGAAGALVLALVGGLIVARRNRETGDEFYPAEEAAIEERSEPEVSRDSDDLVEEELEEFEAEADEVASEDLIADDGLSEEDPHEEPLDDEELQVSQTGDVIGEADIYIAYGRYPQAIGLLLGVLEDDSDRNDVRLKLLELFVETNDQEAFESHMAELVDRCDDGDALLTARELEARLGENDLELGLSSDSDAPVGKDSVEGEHDELAGVDAFDLDLDADSAGGATAEEAEGLEDSPADDSTVEFVTNDEPEESAEPELSQSNLEQAVTEEDFELELDEDAGGVGDQLGGDLGIDFNPDADLETETVDAASEPAGVGVETLSPAADTLGTDTLEDIDFESEVATAEEDEFEFGDEGDSANTKLDLARAYIDMGDKDGARDILKEVLDEGNTDQQQQAQSILEGL